jgi:hypothetical protein
MTTWSCLHAGKPGGLVVLTVDFEPGRQDTGFPDMVPHLPTDLTILTTDAPLRSIHDQEGVDRQLAGWLEQAGTTDATVAAVIGFCAGATIAAWLAHQIAERGPVPSVLFLDPSRASPELLREEFAKASSSLLRAGGEVDSDSSAIAELADPDVNAPDAGLRMVEIARRLSSAYADVVRRVAPTIGVDDDLADDLIDRFADYLRYLAVAGSTAWPSVTDGSLPTLTLVSAGFDGEDAPLSGRRVRMNVGRADLLGDRGVAQAIAEFIGQ